MELGESLDVDVKDVVTFPYCSVANRTVHDTLAGRTLPVNPTAALIIQRCDGTRRFGQVIEDVAAEFGVDAARARQDTLSFLEEADRRAVVRVRRNVLVRLSPRALMTRALELLQLRLPRREHRRYPATLSGCLAATLWATRLPLILAGLTLPPLLYTLVIQPQIGWPQAVVGALVPAAAVLFVLATIAIHELGHLLVVASAARRAMHFRAASLRVSIVGPALAGARGRVVAVAGPALAVGSCLAAITALAPLSLPTGTALVPVVVALGHLGSLLPWSQDGRNLIGAAARGDKQTRERNGH